MTRRLRVALHPMVFAMTLAVAPLGAQSATSARDSVIEKQTRALASQLRCPVCQGLSIEDSPSQLSQQMRDLVRDQLRAGKTPDEVKGYFVSKYGEWILLSPPPHGVNVLIYALPLIVVCIGGAVVLLAVRRWTRAGRGDLSESADKAEIVVFSPKGESVRRLG